MTLVAITVFAVVGWSHTLIWAAYAAWLTSTIHYPERAAHPPWFARYGKWSHDAACRFPAELVHVIRRRRELRDADADIVRLADLASSEYRPPFDAPLIDESVLYHLRTDVPYVQLRSSIAFTADDIERAAAAFSTAARASSISVLPPEPALIPNVRFTTDLVELGSAAAALAVEAGLDAGVIVNDGMPLWFEAVGDGGYTWHFVEYQTDDAGQVLLADPDEPREPATASRAVLVTAEQVDRYYEAITIREGVTT